LFCFVLFCFVLSHTGKRPGFQRGSTPPPLGVCVCIGLAACVSGG
jgi:hypothetical protein